LHLGHPHVLFMRFVCLLSFVFPSFGSYNF
jgi:hypothetical protein